MEKQAEEKTCLVCGTVMKRMGIETIQLNREKHRSLFSAKEHTLLADVYCCSKCGWIARYNRAVGEDNTPVSVYDGTEPITCSRCGKVYDPAFGYCPSCGWKEEN